jgi:hypothetical protein
VHNDAAVLLQPAKHTLDDVARRYLGRSSSLGKPGWVWASWDYRLHLVTVAVMTQGFGIIALIGSVCGDDHTRLGYKHRSTTVGHRRCRRLARQWKTQRYAIGIAHPMNLRRQTAPATSERMILRFFRPLFFQYQKTRVARTAVESIIQVSRSIIPCSFNLM